MKSFAELKYVLLNCIIFHIFFSVTGQIIEPIGETYLEFPHFQWNSEIDLNSTRADQAGYYEVQLSKNSSFSSIFLKDKIEATVSRFVPNKPIPSGTWFWRVRHVNNSGSTSSWKIENFTRPVIPEENIVYITKDQTFNEIKATIRSSFTDAASNNKPILVRFEPAVYNLTSGSARALIDIDETNSAQRVVPPLFSIDGQGSRIIFEDNCRFSYFVNAGNVEIKNLEIDYNQSSLNATHGIVEALVSVPNTTKTEVTVHVPNRGGLSQAAMDLIRTKKHGFFLDPYRQTRKSGLIANYESSNYIGNDRYILTFSGEGSFYLNSSQASEIKVNDLYVMSTGREWELNKFLKSDNITLYNITSYWSRNAAFSFAQSNKINVINCRLLTRYGRILANNNDGGLDGHNPSPYDKILHWFDGVIMIGSGDDMTHVGNGKQAVIRNSLFANSRRNSIFTHANGALVANNTIHNAGSLLVGYFVENTPYEQGFNTLMTNNTIYNSAVSNVNYFESTTPSTEKIHANIGFTNNTFYTRKDIRTKSKIDNVDRYQFTNNTVYWNYDSSDPDTSLFLIQNNIIDPSNVIVENNTYIKASDENVSFVRNNNVGIQFDTQNMSIGVVPEDRDGDGIFNSIEEGVDSDGDGLVDSLDQDSDNDWLPDLLEKNIDSDGDGIPNYLDTDSDNDGIPDKTENGHDTDGDGILNYLDYDSNGNGYPDGMDGNADADNDGLPNFLDLDYEGDPSCSSNTTNDQFYCSNFKTDFGQDAWSYFWNPKGEIGNSDNYSELQENGGSYSSSDVDGVSIRFGSLNNTGGHLAPGSENDDMGVERFLIMRFTAPQSGYYFVEDGLFTGRRATNLKSHVQFFVNDIAVSKEVIAGTRAQIISNSVGYLKMGDHLDIAIGGYTNDAYGSFNINFNITGRDNMAYYSEHWTKNNPKGGWEYLWNEKGDIGQSDNYTPYLFNGSYYDSDGLTSVDDTNNGFGRLLKNSGHPGKTNYYAIASYTVPQSGIYHLENASITSTTNVSNGIDLKIYADDAPIYSNIVSGGTLIDFSQRIGYLDHGTTLHFAVGPNGNSSFDSFTWDFEINYEKDPEVSFVLPLVDSEYEEGDTVSVNVTATTIDEDNIANVALFLDGVSIGKVIEAPYTWDLSGLLAGVHVLKAVAEDNQANTAETTRSFVVTLPKDCAGVPGGTAYIDDCGECVGGSTGNSECHTLAIEDVSKNGLIVYPNPSIKGYYLISKEVFYKIYSVEGKLVKESFGSQINLSKEPKGIYLLYINENVIKLVK